MLPDTTSSGGEHQYKTTLAIGRELDALLRSMDLSDVEADGHVSLRRGGSDGARLWRSNFDQMHDALISSGRLTEQEFAQDIARLDDPEVTWPSPVLWTVRGRRRPQAD
jgi:hypothetical protein